MGNRIIKFINREVSGLHEAAYLLAFFAFLAQLLALVRDRLLAHFFGASHVLDIYYSAFRIPDFIFVIVGSMVSISVLVPFLSEKFEKEKTMDASEASANLRSFIDNTFSLFFLTIVVVSIVAFIFIPWLIPMVLPGFAHDPNLPDLILVTRIMLLSPIFLGFSNFFSSVTQMYNRFFLYALSPLLYNVGIIFGTVVFYPLFGIEGLAFGVVLGAFLHWFIQVPFVLKMGIFPRLTARIDFASIKRVALLSFPRTLTLSSNQISTFFLTALASLMASGSIAIFNFSYNLQSVPLSIIGASYTSAAFPLLSKLFSAGKRKEFLDGMITSSQHIIFWSTPVMVLFMVLRAQIVRTVLGSGQFSWSDTRLTAACLAVFACSIIPQSLILLFVRAYYSEGQTRKPMIINLICSALVVGFGYLFVSLFAHYQMFQFFIQSLFRIDSVAGSEVLMLALAYSIGIYLNTIIHWVAFAKDFKEYSRPVLRTFFQVMSASIIMGYVSYQMLGVFTWWFTTNTLFGIFMQGFTAGVVGIVVCIGLLWLLGSQELHDIWKALHGKIWRAKVIMPEPEVL